MRIISKIIFFVLIFYFFASCTFQNEEEYFGEPVCDSTQVNRDTIHVYYDDLAYIFTGICSQCHSTAFTNSPGILMDSYENVKTSVNTGKVLPAIKHEGRVNMPYLQPKLSDCEIQKIAKWIENGMPEKLN